MTWINHYWPKVPDNVVRSYTVRLTDHIDAVRDAGRRIGVRPDLLYKHDESKWSNEEFPAYALYFCSQQDVSPVDAPNVSSDFANAWLHHIHANPHHWQHWIFPDAYTPKNTEIENGVMEMPQHYALEMIADWMGASYIYTGSWDMSEWLSKNMGKIRLHSKTADYVLNVLGGRDMSDIVRPDLVATVRFGSRL